jgi:LacI family transcriptional regulator
MAHKRILEKSKHSPRRVALAFPVRLAHLHTVVQGIADYAHEHGNWVFTTSGEANDLSIRSLRRWQGDGIITSFGTELEARAARRLKIPVVTFVALVKNPGIPRVMMDQAAIGRLAAEHLLSRGFRHFGFYGVEGAGYSIARESEYSARLASKNFSVFRYLSPNMLMHEQPWDDAISGLCKWIKKLPTPIGVFAVSDARARMLADACLLANRKVPEETGIMGVDNNQIDCEFGSPKLTTIECDWWKVGFQVAHLLDELMNGKPAPSGDQLISPSGVIPRESTDVMVVDHPVVAKAVEFAQTHLGEPFGVKALVTAAGVSRRHLEILFDGVLNRSPAEYLAEIRVQRAKELLRERNMTLSRISQECGFTDLRQFRRVFMRMENVSPKIHRKNGKGHL